MNDDEAFIRSILDAPGGDAPRLVYADWLDERGDPRGGFLRAEREQPRDPDRLRQRARSIDPVWVARVSRPPLGVCCDHLHWGTDILPGPPLTPGDLNAHERQHGVSLPLHYRAFLLNWNGGYPYPGDFYLPDGEEGGPTFRIESFGMILPPGQTAASRAPQELYGPLPGFNPGGGPALAIAADGSYGVLFLGTAGDATGHVYWHGDWTHNGDDLERLIEAAPTLGEFLALLRTHEPESMQAIIRNEPDRLRRCLDEGFDVNWADPESEWSLIDMAAIYHRTECVRELAKRGARATAATPHAARQCGDPEIIALLPAWTGKRKR